MAVNLIINPNTLVFDPKSGKLTRDGLLLFQTITDRINDATSDYVLVDATQTITNKTIDGDANTLSDIPTSALKTKTGTGGRVVSSSGAGTSGDLARWTAAGDVDDGPTPPTGSIVGTSDTQTLTNKTLTSPAINTPTITSPTLTLLSVTVATLPVATTAGRLIYVSDEAGGATVAFSDGTDWRRVQDRAIVS